MCVKNIAILNCNINRSQSLPDMPNHGFINFEICVRTIFPESRIDDYRVSQSVLPENLTQYDCFFITGSAYGVYQKIDWIINLEKCVVQIIQLNTPLIGICFGHQIIAQALGGKIEPAKTGWRLGIKPTTFVPQPWMPHPIENPLNISHIHRDQITQLPTYANVISSPKDCPYESYTIGDTIFALQGHPEFNNDFLYDLLTYLQQTQSLFSSQVFQESLASFKLANGGNTFFVWVKYFVENALKNAHQPN